MTVASLPSVRVPTVFRRVADGLRPKPLSKLRLAWLATARPKQLPPEGTDWDYWFVLAGRGFGKTRLGSEHTVQFCRDNPGAEVGVIGRTDAEARRLLLRGPSGLLACIEPDELDLTFGAGKGYVESPGDSKIRFANGSVIYIVGANSPDALRGLNLWMAWCDELAAWRYQRVIWDDVLDPAVRIGPHPHILVTTTPRPTALMRQLLVEEGVRVVRGSTFDNSANLSPAFKRRMYRKYDVDPATGLARTRAGRQEINAELLDDVVGALLTRDTLDRGRYSPVLGDPERGPDGLEVPGTAPWEFPGIKLEGLYREAVVALDPADGTEEGDEQALALVGLGYDHHLYVEVVEGMRASVTDYLRAGVELARENQATLVVEKNHGSAYLVATLNQVMKDMGVIVPVRIVRASDGKRTRAEPIVPLFERADARLVGSHPELEDQLTTWIGAAGEKSPDRLDAVVWALTHFLGHSLQPDPTDDDTDGVYAAGTGSPDAWADVDEDYTFGYDMAA